MAELPNRVRIVEVGPRDGLQNEQKTIPTDKKAEFVKLLAAAGLTEIEATSSCIRSGFRSWLMRWS